MAKKAEDKKPVHNGKRTSPAKASAKKAPAKRAPAKRTAAKRAPAKRAKTPVVEKRPKRPAGEKMNLVERVLLAQRIVAARHKPKPDTMAVIAAREGIPQRTIEYIYSKYKEQVAGLEDPTGQTILDETLLMYSEIIELLGEATQKGESWAVRVGAARSLMDAKKNQIELLVAMGRMPRSIQAQTDRMKVERMLRRMADVLERRNADPDMIRDLLAVIDDFDGSPELPVIEAPALTA